MPNHTIPLKILMTAGEVSGDRQAAHLASEIHAQDSSVLLYGTGGEMMRRAGVDIAVQTSQYGSVGVQESLRFVKPLRKTLRLIRHLVTEQRPDIAVLIDNEGFNGVLARFLAREQIPFIYYFPPQVWLWGEWRARRIARQAKLIIPAFSPEAEIYRREGGRVEWFGHPLLDIVRLTADPEQSFRMNGLTPSRRTVGILPGSRFQEIEELCDPILGAVRIFLRRYPDLQVVMPLAAPHLRGRVEEKLLRSGLSQRIRLLTENVYDCLSRCDLLLLSSGTATLEGALLGVPMVAAYRVSPVTYAIGKRLVKSRFIAMPNILLNEPVMPELIQDQVTPDALAAIGLKILSDPGRALRMTEKLRTIRGMLGSEGVLHQVAASVLQEAAVSRLIRSPEPVLSPGG
ncbi:MAG: lipid-A-disaccharide synthase [Ignavibacteria bacterium]|nr:lipid-A-disaccharide synthase [Ignavibacteria bacterium]